MVHSCTSASVRIQVGCRGEVFSSNTTRSLSDSAGVSCDSGIVCQCFAQTVFAHHDLNHYDWCSFYLRFEGVRNIAINKQIIPILIDTSAILKIGKRINRKSRKSITAPVANRSIPFPTAPPRMQPYPIFSQTLSRGVNHTRAISPMLTSKDSQRNHPLPENKLNAAPVLVTYVKWKTPDNNGIVCPSLNVCNTQILESRSRIKLAEAAIQNIQVLCHCLLIIRYG